MGKTLLRSAKNYTKGYTDIQIKVRQATSNDPWGPSGSLMADISQSTFNHREYVEIMEMVDKRLNDSGKNWRHVFKALTLLDYLLHTGSEAVITYAREHIHVIKTLKEFQYIDDDGKDQGANVRQKCKDITALLADETRLREERQTRADMRGRMTGLDQFPGVRGGASDQSGYYNEDRELQKALEESRRTARQDASRRDTDKEDEELQRALELSEREAIERRMKERDQEQKAPEPVKKDNIIDFFGDLEDSTPANPYAQQQQQQQPQQAGGFDPFAGFGGTDPFAQQQQIQQQLAHQQQQQMHLQQMFQQQQMQQAQFQPQAQQQQANPFGGNPFGGAQMAAPVQAHLTGDNNALARGSGPIDPFASLSSGKPPGNAVGGQSNPFGGNSDPFGSLASSGGQQQQTQASNAFGGLSANNTGGGFGQNVGFQNTGSASLGGFGMGGHQQGLPQHNTGGPLGFGMGGGGMQQQGISQHNTGGPLGGGFGSGGFGGAGGGISQHNTGGGLMGSGGGFGNQGMGISQHNTGNGGFGSPAPNRLVNLDPNSLGASSAFGAPAAKNPFQTSGGSGGKFQWESPKPAGPTLAQLATQNATNTAFGAPMQQQQQPPQQQQPFGTPFGGGGGNAFGQPQQQQQQQQQQQPFGQMGGFGQQQPQQQMGGMPFGQPQQQQQQQQQPFGAPFGQQQQGGAASFF
ncbi:hypothetical protein HDU88_000306 [Geranomyces variabilis]|nr:hypothetical protein HDU88_000306 [Geranomyces variabilis]